MMIVIGYTEPCKDKLANFMELLNEMFVLTCTYAMYTFTDFCPYVENRQLMGQFLVYLTILNIALNIFVVIRQNFERIL